MSKYQNVWTTLHDSFTAPMRLSGVTVNRATLGGKIGWAGSFIPWDGWTQKEPFDIVINNKITLVGVETIGSDGKDLFHGNAQSVVWFVCQDVIGV